MIIISLDSVIEIIEDLLEWLVLVEPSYVSLFLFIKPGDILHNFSIRLAMIILGLQYYEI